MSRKAVQPISGVVRRAGSPNWQLQLAIPDDVSDRFPQKKWYRTSLGTSDVAAANAKAIPLIAEFRRKVAQYRDESEAESREDSYASDIMALATETGILKAKTPRETGAFIRESTVLAVRAGQRTIEDVHKELDEANRNIEAWSVTAQMLSEALRILEAPSGRDDGITTISKLVAMKVEKEERKNADAYRTSAKLLMSIVGDIDVRHIDKPMARKIRDNISNSTLADATKKRYYAVICALFNWAVDQGKVDANIFDGVKLTVEGKKVLDRSKMDEGAMSLIVKEFCTQGNIQKFVPIIIFTTGARIEEICQLETSDVKTSPGGIPFFRIQGTDDKGVKNENSNRDIPVTRLVWDDLGFREYVEQRAKSGERLLFDVRKWGGRYSMYFRNNFYTPWKKQHGWGQEMGMHSVRHLFTFTSTNYNDKGNDAELREMVLGHLPTVTKVAGVYLRNYSLERAKSWLDAVRWKEVVDFSPLL